MYWLLAREVLRMRRSIPRDEKWDVAVDLFITRDQEELKKLEEEEKEALAAENAEVENTETATTEDAFAEAPATSGWDASN